MVGLLKVFIPKMIDAEFELDKSKDERKYLNGYLMLSTSWHAQDTWPNLNPNPYAQTDKKAKDTPQ